MTARYEVRTAPAGLVSWRCLDCHCPGPWFLAKPVALGRDLQRHAARHLPNTFSSPQEHHR